MKYLYEQEPLTAESLEQELGLSKGDIKEIVVHSSGAVEIETRSALDVAQQDKVNASLSKRNLPRGKKPEA